MEHSWLLKAFGQWLKHETIKTILPKSGTSQFVSDKWLVKWISILCEMKFGIVDTQIRTDYPFRLLLVNQGANGLIPFNGTPVQNGSTIPQIEWEDKSFLCQNMASRNESNLFCFRWGPWAYLTIFFRLLILRIFFSLCTGAETKSSLFDVRYAVLHSPNLHIPLKMYSNTAHFFPSLLKYHQLTLKNVEGSSEIHQGVQRHAP